jgi:phosphatidylglycerophosphate synthase
MARDLLINGMRSIAASQGTVVAAGDIGKWKTAIQMFAIPAVMVKESYFGIPWMALGVWALWFSLVLSVISGVQYMVAFFSSGNQKSKKN